MRFFRKKPDPIAESERQLNARIEALQGELRLLNERLSAPPTASRPGSPTAQSASFAARIPAGSREPIFEAIDHLGVQGAADRDSTPDHFNQLGVRKYDPMTTLRKWLSQIRGTPTSNPKLVNYLAAGSIHGLRPLRYEKRVARNRFLALLAFFVAILWGLIYIYMKNR